MIGKCQGKAEISLHLAGKAPQARTGFWLWLRTAVDLLQTITGMSVPSPNANGWNNTNVSVSFQCADSLSGLAAGSPPAPIVLSSEGATQSVTGTCQDLAGNSASATVSGINIDKTPPAITCSASPSILWPPNNKLVPINVAVALNDSLSGPAGFTLVSVTSNEPDSGEGDVQGFVPGASSTSGQLRAQRLGSGTGRVYTLTYTGFDRAAMPRLAQQQSSYPTTKETESGPKRLGDSYARPSPCNVERLTHRIPDIHAGQRRTPLSPSPTADDTLGRSVQSSFQETRLNLRDTFRIGIRGVGDAFDGALSERLVRCSRAQGCLVLSLYVGPW